MWHPICQHGSNREQFRARSPTTARYSVIKNARSRWGRLVRAPAGRTRESQHRAVSISAIRAVDQVLFDRLVFAAHNPRSYAPKTLPNFAKNLRRLAVRYFRSPRYFENLLPVRAARLGVLVSRRARVVARGAQRAQVGRVITAFAVWPFAINVVNTRRGSRAASLFVALHTQRVRFEEEFGESPRHQRTARG